MPAKSLYICYFGVREPLVQTQVIPYLRELAKDGHEMSLLTFEPAAGDGDKGRRGDEEIREDLERAGINWHRLRYHKRPSVPATLYDVINGTRLIRKLMRREKFDILHSRVHIPMLMAVLSLRLSRHKPKLLFDIRGFFPEEYTDAGIWKPNGLLYRSVKRLEKRLMAAADGFVVLTENARGILFPESKDANRDKNGRPVAVVPCCVDLNVRFSKNLSTDRESMRKRMGLEKRFVVTHLGALGGLYLTENIADLLAAARQFDPSTFAMFLTQSDPNLIVPLLKRRGFEDGDYFVGKIPPAEIQDHLCASDIGISFVRAGYATASRSPTKIPEYLASGVPIIANEGVGDVDALIDKSKIGVIVEDFTAEGYVRALRKITEMGDVRARCRETATAEFDLEKCGGARYRLLYNMLLGEDDARKD